MLYLPPVKSVKDFLLWPFRFIFNLPMHEQAVLGLILTLPVLILTLMLPPKEPAQRELRAEKTAYLKTGVVDSNLDSIRISRGSRLTVLAHQGSLLWAETPDGKYRGFIKADKICHDTTAHSVLTQLPERRKLSRYFISQHKFEEMMTHPATRLDSIERHYIHAEYLRRQGSTTIAEFGFHVVDSFGRQLRPVVRFNAQGEVKDYSLHPWRKNRGTIIHNLPVDLASPLISTSEFQTFYPLDHSISNLIWTYLLGYLPLFLFMIILWLRYPLIWMPNFLANMIIYILLILGPITWYLLLRMHGVNWFPVLPVTIIMIFFGAIFFWAFYSGLRCPRCKHLIGHQHVGTLFGKTFTRIRHFSREVGRKNLKHRISSWKYTKEYDPITHKPSTVAYVTHYYTDQIFYHDFEERSTVQRNTKKYVCPKCGHGKEENYETVLDSEIIQVGQHSKVVSYEQDGQP